MKDSKQSFSIWDFLPLLFWIFLTAFPVFATIGFSSQNAQMSGALSLRILKWLLRHFPFLSALGSVSRLHRLLRKAAHFTLYFIFGCGLRGLLSYQRRVPAIPAVIAIGAAYAASDEFHQRFASGRYASPVDVGIDTCGVIAGCAFVSLLFFLLRKTRPRRLRMR